MTPAEKIAAKKISRIMRAARKQLGLTQQTVASRLGISQGALSKLEHALLIPSAPQWFEFCQMTGIATDSLVSGFIERNRPAKLEEGLREGTFKIPKRYAVHRGSKARATLPFLMYLRDSLGDKKYREYFKQAKIDRDFFIDLDNQVSLEFTLDVSRYLINERFLKPKDVSKLTRPVSQPETHGSLHTRYDGSTANKANLLNLLVMNSRLYECNFNYRIEDQKKGIIDLSVEPEKHLNPASYRNDPILGNFVCVFKRSYFERFMQYGDSDSARGPVVQELECHYKGAPKCVYRFQVAS